MQLQDKPALYSEQSTDRTKTPRADDIAIKLMNSEAGEDMRYKEMWISEILCCAQNGERTFGSNFPPGAPDIR